MPRTDVWVAELAHFFAARTGGFLPEDWGRLILTKVISGPEAVLDLQRDGERLGVAVVIDTCETAGNAAELAVFPAARDPAVLNELLDWGEAHVARGPRDLVDVPAWPGDDPPEDLMFERGYQIGYFRGEMVRPEAAGDPPARAALPPGWWWCEPAERLVHAYYEVRSAAFEAVPGAFLPPYETFRDLALDTESIVHLLLDREGHVQAYVRVTIQPDGSGEISNLGRHPRCRGLGLGPVLVARGLDILWSNGARRIRLDVAATNEAAVELYRSFGFQQTSQTRVYRRAAGHRR
jgi:ribosomal protein S18 acetylase RimI-like enzyme